MQLKNGNFKLKNLMILLFQINDDGQTLCDLHYVRLVDIVNLNKSCTGVLKLKTTSFSFRLE